MPDEKQQWVTEDFNTMHIMSTLFGFRLAPIEEQDAYAESVAKIVGHAFDMENREEAETHIFQAARSLFNQNPSLFQYAQFAMSTIPAFLLEPTESHEQSMEHHATTMKLLTKLSVDTFGQTMTFKVPKFDPEFTHTPPIDIIDTLLDAGAALYTFSIPRDGSEPGEPTLVVGAAADPELLDRLKAELQDAVRNDEESSGDNN
jgi:hypothetical protein